jgi:hypothetical protein
VRLDWPAGWVQRPSEQYVLVIAPPAGGESTISLDVPKLPPHIPGMIPIGSVRNGYLDDLRKAEGRITTADLSTPAVPGASARFVRSTWTSKSGDPWQETALLMVHGDRVYILFGRGPTSEEDACLDALDSVIRSIKWTRP